MKIFLITIFLLMNVNLVFASDQSRWFNFEDRWTDKEIAMEGAWQILNVMDWRQTRYIAKHPQDYSELNPMLGSHPSVGRVDTFMVLNAIGHITVTASLPRDWRPYWVGITLGEKAGAVVSNFRIGLRF